MKRTVEFGGSACGRFIACQHPQRRRFASALLSKQPKSTSSRAIKTEVEFANTRLRIEVQKQKQLDFSKAIRIQHKHWRESRYIDAEESEARALFDAEPQSLDGRLGPGAEPARKHFAQTQDANHVPLLRAASALLLLLLLLLRSKQK